MRTVLVVLAVLTAAACVADVEPSTTPDGSVDVLPSEHPSVASPEARQRRVTGSRSCLTCHSVDGILPKD